MTIPNLEIGTAITPVSWINQGVNSLIINHLKQNNMKMLAHLFNLTCWYIMIPAFVLLFSYIFSFSYIEAVHSGPFVVLYALYILTVTGLYVSSTDEDSEPMSFI
jgi:hypothetical protein